MNNATDSQESANQPTIPTHQPTTNAKSKVHEDKRYLCQQRDREVSKKGDTTP